MKVLPPQIKTAKIGERNRGATNNYFTLMCSLDGEVVKVHTSKSRSYVESLSKEFLQPSELSPAAFWGLTLYK